MASTSEAGYAAREDERDDGDGAATIPQLGERQDIAFVETL